MKPDDACLMLRDDAGSLIDAHVTVERVDDGDSQLAFVLSADCVSSLSVSLTVCDVAVGPTAIVQSGYDAITGSNHFVSYDVGTDETDGVGSEC